ncbi:CYCL1-1 [Linum perenne]
MIYTAIDNFYLKDEQLQNSPSRKDGIDEDTETSLRRYGCDLIQESGILLKLPQAVMATGQVLFHRFFCKKSFAKFNVKKVAAGCVWLASKLEESPRRARHVIIVFHRMECCRENLPIEFLDMSSKKFAELKVELSRTERHILKEMGFVCHVEHPHKFISNYLVTLETPPELRQEAWNLANDRYYLLHDSISARRFQVPLPENPPWWKAFDADKSSIDEICRVLAHLYSLPKAQYMSVCKDGDFSFTNRPLDLPSQSVSKDAPQTSSPANNDASKTTPTMVNVESGGSKGTLIKAASGKLNDSKKGDDELKREEDARGEHIPRSKSDHRIDGSSDRSKEKDRDRERERERERGRESDRMKVDRDRERDREESERDRDKNRDRGRRSKDRGKDSGQLLKLYLCALLYREYHSSTYSSRDKDRHRHQSYS